MSRTSITLKFKMLWIPNVSCKIVNRYKYTASCAWWGKNFGGSFVLDFRKGWRENDLLRDDVIIKKESTTKRRTKPTPTVKNKYWSSYEALENIDEIQLMMKCYPCLNNFSEIWNLFSRVHMDLFLVLSQATVCIVSF